MEFKKQTMELMKILTDPRRNRILLLAVDQPMTVKMMAEQLGEDPLRLYYHVKKLLKADLLEVAESRQQGNLTEHLYRTVNFTDVIYKGDIQEQAEHAELAFALVHQHLNPGLHLYRKALEKIREEKRNGNEVTFESLPYHVSIDSSSHRMTAAEWKKSILPILKAMGKQKEGEEPWPELFADDQDETVGTYQYVLVSYRIEDAVALGLIDGPEDDNEAAGGNS